MAFDFKCTCGTSFVMDDGVSEWTCFRCNQTTKFLVLPRDSFNTVASGGQPAAPIPSKDGGGLRFNDGKPRMDLISPIALLGVAKVLEVGSKKYAEHNWRRGMSWSKPLASLLRHTLKFMAGEDLDAETGLPHVDLMACNVMFLQEYFREHKNLDDRFKVKLEEEEEPKK